MGFSTALSGLNAASKSLSVTGNNIANSQTTGFKESRAQFGDVYNSSLGTSGSTAVGTGVNLSAVAQQFTQGNIEATGNSLDLALSGPGFFSMGSLLDPIIPDKPLEATSFTRNGAFHLNNSGNIVDDNGNYLLAFKPVGTTVAEGFNVGVKTPVLLQTNQGAPAATKNVTMDVNLNGAAPQVTIPLSFSSPNPPFIPDPKTYNSTTSITSYDSLGNAHIVSTYFAKTTVPNEWKAYTFIDGRGVNPGQQQDTTVSPITPASGAAVLTAGVVPNAITMTFDDAGNLITGLNPQIIPDPTSVSGFVNGNSKAVNATGHLVDASGNLIDSNGAYVDSNNHLISSPTDAFPGALVDKNGKYVDINGHFIDPTNNSALIDGDKKSVNAAGHFVDPANPTSLVDSTGKAVNISDHYIDPTTGALIDVNGKSVNTNNHFVDPTSGALVDSTGALVDANGYYVDTAGAFADATGATLPTTNAAGNTITPIPLKTINPVLSKVTSSLTTMSSTTHTTYATLGKFNSGDGVILAGISGGTGGQVATTHVDFGGIDINSLMTTLAPDGTASPSIKNVAPMSISLDFKGSTQFSTPFTVNNLKQDGLPVGNLTGVDVDKTGVIFAKYSNGYSQPIGQVALARFPDNQSLSKVAGTTWQASADSGAPIYGAAGDNNFGSIQSSAIENSNVDLSAELVKLIIAQQAYQANSQTITSQKSMMDTILRI